jgi:phage repressor protein C with HTH and peptisase S24 domain
MTKPQRKRVDSAVSSKSNEARTHDVSSGQGHRAPDDLSALDPARLAEVVGAMAMRDPDHPIWDHEPFLRWLADEARVGDPRSRRRGDSERRASGESFRLRVEAKRLRMLRVEAPAPSRPPDVRGLPREVLDRATAAGAVPLVDLAVAAGVGTDLWDEPCEEWVVMPNELPSGHYLALKVVGDSMEPMMHTGDTVLVRLGGTVERSTVIVARHPDDGYVCKRVSRVHRDRLELESLRPGRPVIVIPRKPDLVVGTVVLVWCEHAGLK